MFTFSSQYSSREAFILKYWQKTQESQMMKNYSETSYTKSGAGPLCYIPPFCPIFPFSLVSIEENNKWTLSP